MYAADNWQSIFSWKNTDTVLSIKLHNIDHGLVVMGEYLCLEVADLNPSVIYHLGIRWEKLPHERATSH